MTEVIGSPDLALLRAPVHGTPHTSLLFWPLREVGRATINQIVFLFPLAQITVTSPSAGWANVRPGQLIQVVDGGGNLIMTNCVRKTPTGTTCYISAMGEGDPGAAQLIARDLANGYTIIVYDYQPLWSFRSRISQGVFYKFYDLAYTDQGTNPPPVCNFGQWDHGFDDTGMGVSKTYNASASRAWNGKTITSYQYVIVGPGYSVTGGALNSVTFTATFQAGFHLIYCTVTDSGGKTKTGVRPLWITPRFGANAPFNMQEAVILSDDRQDLQSRQIKYDIWGSHDLLQSVAYDGAAVFQIEYATHGGSVLSPGVLIDRYVGFMTSPNRTGTLQHTIISGQTLGPMARLAKVGNASQAIIEADSPADWTQVQTGLGTPSFAAFYVLEYHCPNALALFDYHVLPEQDTTPVRKHSYGLTEQNIQAQLNQVQAMVQGNLGSASDGSFYFFRNPNLENDAFRNAMETRMTLTSPIGTGIGDLAGDVQYPVEYPVPISTVTLGGFVVDALSNINAYEAIAPSVSEAQGGTKQDGGSIAVSDVTDLLWRVGDLFAQLSSPTPNFQQGLLRNLDVADPARHYNTWFALDIPSRFDPRGNGYSGRALVTGVARNWKQTGSAPALKEISATITPETQGKPGQLLPLTNSDYVAPELAISDQPPYSNFAWACNDQGAFGACSAVQSFTATWRSIKGAIAGNVVDFDFDYHSPLILSGFRSGALGMWAVSIYSGTTVRIWYSPNVLITNPVWTEQQNYVMADASTVTQAHLVANRTTAHNAWVAWRTEHLTYAAKTIDGSTWDGSPTAVGTSHLDTSHDDAALGLAIEHNRVIVTAHRPPDLGGNSFYQPYWADAVTGTFDIVRSLINGNAPNAAIAAGLGDTIYVSVDRDPVNVAHIFATGYLESVGDTTPTLVRFTGTPEQTQNWNYPCASDAVSFDAFGVNLDAANGTYSGTMVEQWSLGGYHDWQATRVDVRLVIQSWNYAMGAGFSVDYQIDLLDAAGATLDSHSGTYSHTRANNNISECAASTISITGLTVNNVAFLRVTLTATFDKTAPNQILWKGIDGIAVYVNRNFTYRSLYNVLDYQIPNDALPPPVWTVIPTAADAIPRHPYAIAPDGPSGSLSWLADDGSTIRLYESSDGGITVAQVRSGIHYTGLRRSGNRLLLWGSGVIDVSSDGGRTTQARIGNWASAIGTPGVFLKVGAIA